jgi:transposase
VVYFLSKTLETDSKEPHCQCVKIIREIEVTFRVLKRNLDLRPIYHQKDENTMALLHLGILAYGLQIQFDSN